MDTYKSRIVTGLLNNAEHDIGKGDLLVAGLILIVNEQEMGMHKMSVAQLSELISQLKRLEAEAKSRRIEHIVHTSETREFKDWLQRKCNVK